MNTTDFAVAFKPESLAAVYHARIAKSRSVGKDGIRHVVFLANLEAECELISRKVLNGTYRFTPFREKLIPRGAQRCPRQISVPTVRDRLALRVVCNLLKECFPHAKTTPPHAYIRECAVAMQFARQNSSFLRMDIKEFYPTIRHDLLLEQLQQSSLPEWMVALIINAIATPTGSSLSPQTIGVPQGLSISNALATIYMAPFDAGMRKAGFFKRYVDDILVIAPSEAVNSIYTMAHSLLSNLGLTSHPMGTPGKTEQVRLNDGVQYLGYVLNPSCISIRKSSFNKAFNSLFRIITSIKYQNRLEEKERFRLNLKITGCYVNGTRRGWLMFFAQTQDIGQLKHLDSFLTSELRRLGFNRKEEHIKTFVKAFYEIRFNANGTNYIPNFDTSSREERLSIISLLSGVPLEVLATRSSEFLENEFSRLISREVIDLEKDVIEPFS